MIVNKHAPWGACEVVKDFGGNRQLHYDSSGTSNAPWRILETNAFIYFDTEESALNYAIQHGYFKQKGN